MAESFFSSLKKERIRKRIYKTRALARADIFDYIEVFYNWVRRHVTSAASVRRTLNMPRREDKICLLSWGQSTLFLLFSPEHAAPAVIIFGADRTGDDFTVFSVKTTINISLHFGVSTVICAN